jgi:hypothetical protein
VRGLVADMHPYIAKIVPEARFEEGPGGWIERFAWRVEHIMHDRRRLAGRWFCRRSRLGLQHLRLVFLLARGAFTPDLRGRGADGKARSWYPHHLVDDAVCLTLQWIADRSDNKLRLYSS